MATQCWYRCSQLRLLGQATASKATGPIVVGVGPCDLAESQDLNVVSLQRKRHCILSEKKEALKCQSHVQGVYKR